MWRKSLSSSNLKTPGFRGPAISKIIFSQSTFAKNSRRYLALKAISFSSPSTTASTSTDVSPKDGALAEITIFPALPEEPFSRESFIMLAASLANIEQVFTAF